MPLMDWLRAPGLKSFVAAILMGDFFESFFGDFGKDSFFFFCFFGARLKNPNFLARFPRSHKIFRFKFVSQEKKKMTARAQKTSVALEQVTQGAHFLIIPAHHVQFSHKLLL